MLTILRTVPNGTSLPDFSPYRPFRLQGIKTIGVVPGEQYVIRYSGTRQRAFVLVSVDGVNVLTGRPAVASPDEPGFPLESAGELRVTNWQEDGRGGGALVFTTQERSVGTFRSDSSALGYISVLVYIDEIPYPPTTYRPHPSGFGQGYGGGEEELLKSSPQLIGQPGYRGGEPRKDVLGERLRMPFPSGESAPVGTGIGRRIDNPVGLTRCTLSRPVMLGLEQVRYLPIAELRGQLLHHPSGFLSRPMADLADIPREGDNPVSNEFVSFGISRFGDAATSL